MDNKPMNGDSLNTKSPDNKNKNKKLFILLGVLGLMIIIVILVFSQGRKTKLNSNNSAINSNNSAQSTTSANVAVSVKNSNLIPAPIATTTNLSKQEVAQLKTAKVVVPGANPISSDNKVLTPQGAITNSAARSIAPNAPKQTGFLNKATLPKTLVKLSIANNVFTPNTLTTKAGAPTSFALTSADNLVHVLNFNSPSLAAIVILVGPGQTKAITFNAPTKPGSYIFHDDTPGSTATGTLIVE